MRHLSRQRLKQISLGIWLVYFVALAGLGVVLVGTAAADRNNVNYHWTQMRTVVVASLEDGDKTSPVGLPHIAQGLEPGQSLTLSFAAETSLHDNLMFKVTGASLRVFIDDRLYLSTGQPDTYPAYQQTPSPEVIMLALPNTEGVKHFRLEYTVAEAVDTLSMPELYIGDSTVLFIQLLSDHSLTLAMSMMLLLGGAVLIGIALLAMRSIPSALTLVWLGISCLAFGLWNISSNDLAVYLMPLQSLLYSLSYIGMLAVVSPLTALYRTVLDRPSSLVLKALSAMAAGLALIAVALHLSGAWPFAISGRYIRAFVPFSLIVLGAFITYEYWRLRDPYARRLIAPTLLLSLFSAADLVFMALLPGSAGNGILLLGFMLFTAWMIVFGMRYVDQAFEQARQSEQLAVEVDALASNLEKQRDLYLRLSDSAEQIRRMRHDMRHQLSALRGYLEAGDSSGAIDYIEQIEPNSANIAQMMLTDNFTVNAVVNHYQALADANQIQTDLMLVVPADLGRISESDMSIIFGNLFENAIEASLYLPEDRRVIRMRSQVVKKNLTITVDNAFDGVFDARGGVFYSRKRTGKGIGLSSVHSIVERYDGTIKVEVANGQFMVSLMVRM
jgi:signal transduction histidine kinase